MTTANGEGVIRTGLRTIVRGFLLGVGFSVALGGFYSLAWHWTINKAQAAIGDIAPSGEISIKDVVLSDVEEQRHDGLSAIIGSATNSGKVPARNVQVQAELFEHGKFVDQYSTYISGTIAPGESKHFKISCGCKDSPAAEHDSYKVEVVSGY